MTAAHLGISYQAFHLPSQDILYLMIVNMPSELEMTTARQQVRIDGQVHTTSDVDFLAVDV